MTVNEALEEVIRLSGRSTKEDGRCILLAQVLKEICTVLAIDSWEIENEEKQE